MLEKLHKRYTQKLQRNLNGILENVQITHKKMGEENKNKNKELWKKQKKNRFSLFTGVREGFRDKIPFDIHMVNDSVGP